MSKSKELNTLRIKKMKLDKFFSMYLDLHGDKLDTTEVGSKYWTLYNSKLKEYEGVAHQIRVAEYTIQGHAHV